MTTTKTKTPAPYRIQWGHKLTMRDGVELNATLYLPVEPNVRLPAIVTRTPYVTDTNAEDFHYFASQGFVCAVIDCRGRGNSGGVFTPWVNDAEDGYDTIEAIARHPNVDGRVVTWGGSYLGFNQWATASLQPPSLKAMAPVASVYPAYDYPTGANVPFYYDIVWLTLTSGRTDNRNLFTLHDYWGSVFYRHHQDGAAFKDLDVYAGNTSTRFQDWAAHPDVGPYWDAFVPTDAQYAAIDIPVLHITGSHDGDQGGALNYYRRFTAQASKSAIAKQNLIMGPWDHPGTRKPKAEFCGIKVGPASLVDLRALHVEWYNWVLRGGNKPAFLDAPVKWYEIGNDTWHGAASLADVHTATQTFHLKSGNGGSGSLLNSGSLTTTLSNSAETDSYISDPNDLKYGPLLLEPDTNVLTDQRDLQLMDGDALVYHTPVLIEDMVLAGSPQFEADIAMTTQDADVLARLYVVTPGGTCEQLSWDILRARYRNSFRQAELMIPNQSARFKFERFTWIGRHITAGSRLRLVLTSPKGLFYQTNFQGGGVVAEETRKDAKVATITLKTSTAVLRLPVCP
jgi:uncharacterized protein